MDQQDVDHGFSPAAFGVPAAFSATPQEAAAPAFALRPLSTGEVLDRTFTLYRKRFWLFVGIGTLPAAVLTLSGMVRMIYLALTHHPTAVLPGAPAGILADAMSNTLALQLYLLPATVLFIVAYGVSHAAIVDAFASIMQGIPVTAASAYRAVRGRWLRWTGIALRQLWTFFWPFLLPLLVLGASFAIPAVRTNTVAAAMIFLVFGLLSGAGFVLGVINVLRVALAIPAGVQENTGVSGSLRRSRDLVAGRKGRIFLALLLVYALQLVAGGIQVPLLLLAATTRGGQQVVLQAIELVVQFLVTALVSPIASIALCLFYIDERVRREGYDIELLMHRSFAAPVTPSNPQGGRYSSQADPAA